MRAGIRGQWHQRGAGSTGGTTKLSLFGKKQNRADAMAMPSETDVSTPRYLRDKYAIVGVGETTFTGGATRLGGRRPNNTSGGHLCEGYTHGMNMVIENVRQLRHDVDDSCPVGPDGKRQHTYDYSEGGCRQVRNIEVTANLGWANPMTTSAMVMRRG